MHLFKEKPAPPPAKAVDVPIKTEPPKKRRGKKRRSHGAVERPPGLLANKPVKTFGHFPSA